MLEVKDLQVVLRQDRGRQGHQLHRRRGPGRHPDRHQRRRQDHDAAHHLRTAQPEPARSASRASGSTARPAHEIVALGLAHSPEGRRIFPRLTRRGEPRARRVRPQGHGRHRQGHATRPTTLFPILGERREPAGRHVLRRRAADARHRPGHDEPAQAADAGRALDGPVAAHDAADHGDHPELKSAGHDDPAGRAERPGRAVARRPRATSSRSARSSSTGTGQELLHDERRPQGLPRRGLSPSASGAGALRHGRGVVYRSGTPTGRDHHVLGYPTGYPTSLT